MNELDGQKTNIDADRVGNLYLSYMLQLDCLSDVQKRKVAFWNPHIVQV